jgi:Fuc2NAc and GlcNAc transferase
MRTRSPHDIHPSWVPTGNEVPVPCLEAMNNAITPALLALAAGVALVTSALATSLFRRLAASWGLLDQPNPRSSHATPIPRGGGAPLLIGATVGLAAAGGTPSGPAGLAVALGTVLVGLVGFVDDRRGLSPLVRLAVHFGAAGGVVATAGGLVRLPLPRPLDVELGNLGPLFALLWMVAVVNFYNFLDGIDGLAGLQGVITGAGIALCSWEPFAAALGAALSGACLGFLRHNWSPARVFLGDVGSGALGFAFASTPFLAPTPRRSAAVLFVALSLWLFLADAGWTLALRAARGARLYRAHREHHYQRLVIGGWSHPRVTAALGAGSLLLTSVALLAFRGDRNPLAWLGLGLALSLFGAEAALVRRSAQ